MAITIRLTEEEKMPDDSYAKYMRSLGEVFKRALLEKIEDEYDIVVSDEAYKEYMNGKKKSKPITELWKECNL